MKQKIVVIVQARMGSTRLHGKMMKLIKGRPMIYYLIQQLKYSKMPNEVILATSTNKENDVLCDFVKSLGTEVFRGPEEDVLKRYVLAVIKYKADIIVRITGDEPLIEPFIVDAVIKDHLDKGADYTSTKLDRTIPQGLDCEVFSKEVLLKIDKLSKTNYEREHVTPYIYNNPKEFKINAFRVKEKYDCKHILTVDTEDDFKLIKRIIEQLYQEGKAITIREILGFFS